jgi:hypothetical protein
MDLQMAWKRKRQTRFSCGNNNKYLQFYKQRPVAYGNIHRHNRRDLVAGPERRTRPSSPSLDLASRSELLPSYSVHSNTRGGELCRSTLRTRRRVRVQGRFSVFRFLRNVVQRLVRELGGISCTMETGLLKTGDILQKCCHANHPV